MTDDAGSVEVARFLSTHIQVAAQVGFSRTQFLTPTDFGFISRHLDLALGLNAWVTRNIVLKAAVHDFAGHRFLAAPAVGSAPDRTVLYEVGGQFAF